MGRAISTQPEQAALDAMHALEPLFGHDHEFSDLHTGFLHFASLPLKTTVMNMGIIHGFQLQ